MIWLRRTPDSLTIMTVILCIAGCLDEPDMLIVGDIGYSEEELLGLNADRRLKLAEITAFGIAVSREESDHVLAPLLKQTQDQALLEQLAAHRFVETFSISERELRTHYSTNPSFELIVRHILFFSERWRPKSHRDNARNKAEIALLRIDGGDHFPEIAAELSEEPGAEGRQGLLEPGREGSWVSEFWNAAMALEINGISPVTETQYGFHILRLEGKKEIPFEEVRSSVVLEVANLMGFRKEIPKGLSLDDTIATQMTVPENVLNELFKAWQEQNLRWETFLGFEPNMNNQEIKRLAKIALGSTGQNATIARNELEEAGDLLSNAYLILDHLDP